MSDFQANWSRNLDAAQLVDRICDQRVRGESTQAAVHLLRMELLRLVKEATGVYTLKGTLSKANAINLTNGDEQFTQ